MRLLTTLAGAVEQLFLYDAYGADVAIFNAAGGLLTRGAHPSTAIRYNGEYFDSATELYYFRARVYSAQTGRFPTLDPYRGSNSRPQTFHKYLFTHADPIQGVDPSGKYLIAIDGTGTRDWLTNPLNPQKLPNKRWLSHVNNFAKEYDGERKYYFGPSNGQTASDMPSIEEAAYQDYINYRLETLEHTEEPVDIIVWSRGAYAAMRLARRLDAAEIPVRFLGLYDPVDMTFYDSDTWAGGSGTQNQISDNVQNAVWIHGKEYVGGGPVDYDSGSWMWYNWPRINVEWNSSTTKMTNLELSATHGAIGGAPGYSPDTTLGNYNFRFDVGASIRADWTMRSVAQSVGVPIPVLQDSDYGFPRQQSDLPQIRSRTWGLHWSQYTPRINTTFNVSIAAGIAGVSSF